ncbi:MAG: phosphatase PAP2 family protein [Pseudomonadota bacterium]
MNTPFLLPEHHPLALNSWRVWAVPLAALLGALLIATPERNAQVFLALNHLAAGGLEAPWEWLTALGDALTALCIVLMLARLRPGLVLSAILAALLSTLLINGLKDLLDVPRPPAVLGEAVNVVGDALRKGAFPSGHTATAFTLVGVLAAYVRSARLLAGLVLLATLVGFSRIAVGVHWPLDVCGGAFLGWTSGLAGVYLARRWGWEGRPRVLGGVHLLLLGCALVLLLGHDSGYPQADLLEKGVALAALAIHLALRPGAGLPGAQAGRLPQAAKSGSA